MPATTVARLYDQLKKEGVIGSIWGSKTVIEPRRLDNELSLRGTIALPIPIRAFSASTTYRAFVRAMQATLWNERFGCQIVFYDETCFEGAAVTDALLDTTADIVVWLAPSSRMTTYFARLRDRGLKVITISEQMPINGEPGYYLNWRSALLEALRAWKRAGVRDAEIVNDGAENSSSLSRVVTACLNEVGIALRAGNAIRLADQGDRCGCVFLSTQSVLEFGRVGLSAEAITAKHLLFIHGTVDLAYQPQVNRSFEGISFDWQAISRRIVRDLTLQCWSAENEQQAIFNGRWVPGATLI
ncbi:MAG: hypothetical protein ACJ74Y_17040 [Bryobacteraceae bacterium]